MSRAPARRSRAERHQGTGGSMDTAREAGRRSAAAQPPDLDTSSLEAALRDIGLATSAARRCPSAPRRTRAGLSRSSSAPDPRRLGRTGEQLDPQLARGWLPPLEAATAA